MEQTVKKKIGVRDVMTIAAMMVINLRDCNGDWYGYIAFPGSIFVRFQLELMPLLEQLFIWLRQIALTNTDCCLLGLQFMD